MVSIVEAQGLRKTYGALAAVDNVSFTVAEGEVFGILGPNGAGKPTAVECVESLRIPDAGTIRVAGFDPIREHRLRRGCAGPEPGCERELADVGPTWPCWHCGR